MNAPAIDGINSTKPRKDGKPSLYNQNVEQTKNALENYNEFET